MSSGIQAASRDDVYNLNDLRMIEAMRDSFNTTMNAYMRKENEYITRARNAISDERKELYLAEAARYRSYINDIIECRNYMTDRANNIRTIQANRPSHFMFNLFSRNTSSTVDIQIPSSTPISIPPTFTSTDIPDEYICPITMQIMTDPVILTDGHVYERKAIEQWLTTHDTSPISKQPVDKKMVIPCFVLRNLIEAFVATTANKVHIMPKKTQTREPSKYNIFVQERMPKLKQEYPNKAPKELMKLIGAEWRVKKI